MLNNIALGSYYPGTSLLHRLQARTKLLLLLWVVVWLTIANHLQWHLEPYAVAIGLLGLGIFFSGIEVRVFWQRLWLLVLLTVLGIWPILTAYAGESRTVATLGPLVTSYGVVRSVLLSVGGLGVVLLCSMYLTWSPLRDFWSRSGPRHFRWPCWLLGVGGLLLFVLLYGYPAARPFLIGPVLITSLGVWTVIIFSSFLLLLYTFSLLLTLTTSPMALIEGMRMLLAPLRRLNLPVDSFTLMTLLALRFVPTLLEQVEQMSKAQMARGADLTSGKFRERLQSLTMLFVPLVHGVLRQAEELATALEARGYQSVGRQTPLHESTFQRIDYIVVAVVIVLTLASLFF